VNILAEPNAGSSQAAWVTGNLTDEFIYSLARKMSIPRQVDEQAGANSHTVEKVG
jgi:hypothetical protein